MPISLGPLDSLRDLAGTDLRRKTGDVTLGDGNLYEDPSLGAYGLADTLKSDAQDRLFAAQRTGDVNETNALQGLIGQYQKDMDTGPIGRQMSDMHAQDEANAEALRQGFGPTGMDTVNSPSATAARFGRQMQLNKDTMPLQVEKYKADAARQLEDDRASRLLKIFGGRLNTQNPPVAPAGSQPGAPSPAGNPRPAPQGPISGTAPAGAPDSHQAGPVKSIGFMDFLLGRGPKYSNLGDLADARMERAKYDLGIPTPFAKIAQDVSFANLSQIQAQFPGIRGVQHLLTKFGEHQANWGHETPAATLQRLDGMLGMLGDLEQSLDDPSLRFKQGAQGELQLAMPPQAIERAKLLATDTRAKLNEARSMMVRQYPGIEQALGQAVSQPAGPQGTKQYLDENGNIISR